MIEDTPDEGNTPGVVPDWVEHGGSGPLGYREVTEAKGDRVDEVMKRELIKQSNLRARLIDLGVPVDLRDQCFVHGDLDPQQDTIIMPWTVIYSLIESDVTKQREHHGAMGVLS